MGLSVLFMGVLMLACGGLNAAPVEQGNSEPGKNVTLYL